MSENSLFAGTEDYNMLGSPLGPPTYGNSHMSCFVEASSDYVFPVYDPNSGKVN